jgi:di/tricarboxylate transporter
MGYQTNTGVYGPGGYRFGDSMKAGLPLKVIAIVIWVLVIPRLWPF